VRGEHIAALEAKLDELAEVSGKAIQTQAADDTEQVYRLAREILADAGIFGLKHISRAAHSLCELMAAGDRHRHQWAGVAIHVEAISILRKGEGAFGGTDVDAMLAGLEKISRTSI
jgi:chemotaxis protein histidine kinase CheA